MKGCDSADPCRKAVRERQVRVFHEGRRRLRSKLACVPGNAVMAASQRDAGTVNYDGEIRRYYRKVFVWATWRRVGR